MVLLALEGVADMGAAIIDSNFNSGLFTGASVGLSPLDIAKLVFQLGEESSLSFGMRAGRSVAARASVHRVSSCCARALRGGHGRRLRCM